MGAVGLTTETPRQNEGTVDQNEADARANAFIQAYKTSHANGPYPKVEIKSKDSAMLTTG